MANQVPSLLLGFAVTALMFAMSNRQSEIRDLQNRMSHTHAADGSVNGIRGWY